MLAQLERNFIIEENEKFVKELTKAQFVRAVNSLSR